MKAIYINSMFDPNKDLEKLNQDLKDCHRVVWHQQVNEGNISSGGFMCYGTILIVDNYTRKDKLKKINKFYEKGTSDNSL
jgi:hypothetical protein